MIKSRVPRISNQESGKFCPIGVGAIEIGSIGQKLRPETALLNRIIKVNIFCFG